MTEKIKIKVDGKEFSVLQGVTIMEALKKEGIEIPNLCYLKNYAPFTSCMICLVEEESGGELILSCATTVSSGLSILTNSPLAVESRKAALGLLLREHTGDCEAPCRITCPGTGNIPKMMEDLRAEDPDKAYGIIRQDLLFPETLGILCSGPCEKGCRRGRHDFPLGIKSMHRRLGEMRRKGELEASAFFDLKGTKGSVALIGAGLGGLALSHFLSTYGYECKVFEKEETPGGWVKALPGVGEVFAQEIDFLFKDNPRLTLVKRKIVESDMEELKSSYDHIVFAGGENSLSMEGVHTFLPTQYSSGLIVRTIKEARSLAAKIAGQNRKVFNCKMGGLKPGEMEEFLKGSSIVMDNREETELSLRDEARLCLVCHCESENYCKLRRYATDWGVSTPLRSDRFSFTRSGEEVWFEPSKCIRCGKCVTLSKNEKYGFNFTGRGYGTTVGPPRGISVEEALGESLDLCVQACPTGALRYKGV